MRLFAVTMLVYYPDDTPLPQTFREWLTEATGLDCSEGPAVATVLESVREMRHPLAPDVIERRMKDRGGTFLYG